MKSIFMRKSLEFIIKNNPSFSSTEIDKIKYGLEAIYITVTKFLIISLITAYLNVFREFLIFTFFFSALRMAAFGLHVSKSFICLILSSIMFISLPILALNIEIDLFTKILLITFSFFIILFYAPADTHKRPIIKLRKRKRLRNISILITILYTFLIIFNDNSFLSNIILFALTAESILILPLTYKLFKLPYANYKSYHFRIT